LFGGAKPTKDPRGDGTALISGQSSAGFRWWGAQAWWEAPCADAKCLGRGWSMKSPAFPHMIMT